MRRVRNTLHLPRVRSTYIALAAFFFSVGCEQASPSVAASSASTVAPTPSATASTKAEDGLTAAKPKPYKSTDVQALGTLPDGIGIAVGEKAPDLSLPDKDGKQVQLADVLKKKEALVVFYRGGW